MTMLNLPDEILLQIITLAVARGSSVKKAALRLSVVCKRLRAAIVSNRSFWSSVSSSMPNKEWMQTHVERSGTVGLSIDISDADGRFSNAPIEALSVAQPEERRWRSFSFILHDGAWWHFNLSDMVKTYLSHREVPQLETLRVGYKRVEVNEYLRFFNNWIMPKLRTLEVVNIVPALRVIPAGLRKFSMAFQGGKASVRLEDLQEFIEKAPSIEELSLSFIDDEVVRQSMDPEAPTVVPNVKTLNVLVKDCHPPAFKSVLDAFTFPKLKNLSVILKFNYENRITRIYENEEEKKAMWMVSHLLSNESFHNSTTSLSLTAFAYNLPYLPRQEPPFMSLSPIERFCNLKHFRVESNLTLLVGPPHRHDSVLVPELSPWQICPETIHLVNCTRVTHIMVAQLINAIGSDSKLDAQLREFRVEGCPMLSPQRLEGIVPAEKLVWSETAQVLPLMLDGTKVPAVCVRSPIRKSLVLTAVRPDYESPDLYTESLFCRNHLGEPFLAGISSDGNGKDNGMDRWYEEADYMYNLDDEGEYREIEDEEDEYDGEMEEEDARSDRAED